jgi:hypothetical protein
MVYKHMKRVCCTNLQHLLMHFTQIYDNFLCVLRQPHVERYIWATSQL